MRNFLFDTVYNFSLEKGKHMEIYFVVMFELVYKIFVVDGSKVKQKIFLEFRNIRLDITVVIEKPTMILC